MTDTQAVDVVTLDFKGTRIRCFFSGSTLRCKSFLNDQSLYGENLNEMHPSIWNWQTYTSSGHNFIVSVY